MRYEPVLVLLGFVCSFGVWVLFSFSGSYLLSYLIEFNQGDLCLSAHIPPVPVQKETSRGTMCAGSAQVTLVELRGSYHAGCKPNKRAKHPNTKQPKTKNTKNTKGREATCCATHVAVKAAREKVRQGR